MNLPTKKIKLSGVSLNNMKIIFLGTPQFAAIILEKLAKTEYKPILVVTEPDKPAGRKQVITPPPAKISAQKYNIAIVQPEKVSDFVLRISDLKPDLVVVAAYGQILPKEILEIPKYGCLNIHPSLLPKYRGPSPIQYAILNGDKETGVNIILMEKKVDSGPIISNIQLPISNKVYYKDLEEKLAETGAKLLIDTIPKWINGEIKPAPQDEEKATYTKIIKKEDGKIDWRKPVEEIERQIRAFQIWPGSFTDFNGKTLKIIEAEVLEIKTNKRIGEVFLADNEKLAVQTGQNCLILLKIQLEGKKPMSAQDFLRGHRQILGTILND